MKYINVPQSTYWGSKYAYHSEILANLRQALNDGVIKEIPEERAKILPSWGSGNYSWVEGEPAKLIIGNWDSSG